MCQNNLALVFGVKWSLLTYTPSHSIIQIIHYNVYNSQSLYGICFD